MLQIWADTRSKAHLFTWERLASLVDIDALIVELVHIECIHGIYNTNHKAVFPKMVSEHFLVSKDKGKRPAHCCQSGKYGFNT